MLTPCIPSIRKRTLNFQGYNIPNKEIHKEGSFKRKEKNYQIEACENLHVVKCNFKNNDFFTYKFW